MENPPAQSGEGWTPFRTLRPWLIETFGRPVHRVALDAGSSCPNRDGVKGFGGCTYCDVEGSGTGALRTGEMLAAPQQEYCQQKRSPLANFHLAP